jgi:hypothetical protein
MKKFLFLAALITLLACGGKTPEERLVGWWEAEMFGETMAIEFRDDGTVYSEQEDEIQMWAIQEGDPLILEVWDADDRHDSVELELVFEGHDEATLSAEGMTATMVRLDRHR